MGLHCLPDKDGKNSRTSRSRRCFEAASSQGYCRELACETNAVNPTATYASPRQSTIAVVEGNHLLDRQGSALHSYIPKVTMCVATQ